MCGIVGIVGSSPVNQQIYDALTVLQHRGQDAAGIMTAQGGELFLRKDVGLVRDVFQQRHMLQLKGNVRHRPRALPDRRLRQLGRGAAVLRQLALRHLPRAQRQPDQCRGARRRADARGPAPPEHRLGLGGAAERARERAAALRHAARVGRPTSSPRSRAVYRRVRGGYAVVAMIMGHGVVGFRDPNGIRPLVIGTREGARGREYMLASESVALDQAGFERLRDVGAGRGRVHRRAGPHAQPAVRRCAAPHALHLRVRLFRAARLDHRQHLGLQGAHAHGRAARREDPARAAVDTTSTS